MLQWLFDHPAEIVVLWISRHGNDEATGEEQYPKVSVETKQAFWEQLQELFGDMLIDHDKTPLAQTSIEELVSLGTRIAASLEPQAEIRSQCCEGPRI